MGGARGKARGGTRHKFVALLTINVSNCVCHSVYSVLASFFPQAASAKGLTAEPVGLIFAVFAAVVFITAPCVATALSRHGKRTVYLAGLATVCVSTIAFGFADHIENPEVYFMYCVLFRCVQGFGAALEETAAYALIADIDPEAVSFNLGMTEISTGLGYMVGPTVGGFLFSFGGYHLPYYNRGRRVGGTFIQPGPEAHRWPAR
jgi:MFS family permease